MRPSCAISSPSCRLNWLPTLLNLNAAKRLAGAAPSAEAASFGGVAGLGRGVGEGEAKPFRAARGGAGGRSWGGAPPHAPACRGALSRPPQPPAAPHPLCREEPPHEVALGGLQQRLVLRDHKVLVLLKEVVRLVGHGAWTVKVRQGERRKGGKAGSGKGKGGWVEGSGRSQRQGKGRTGEHGCRVAGGSRDPRPPPLQTPPFPGAPFPTPHSPT